MTPNLEEIHEEKRSTSLENPEEASSYCDDDDADDGVVDVDSSRVCVPLEQNLRKLLVKVTGTYDLQSVTVVKLRVIARDVPLQHIEVHTPSLRELILDGSVISTLRDLGILKNLKVLRVNRCGLNCLDNMLSFESLEELYASDNYIKDPIPCAFLPNIRTIDLKRNCLKDLMRTLKFLTLCDNLEHIHLEGNGEVRHFTNYRRTVKSLLPSLESLDGINFSERNMNSEQASDRNNEIAVDTFQKPIISSFGLGSTQQRFRPHLVSDINTSFTVNFPPRVFLGSDERRTGKGEKPILATKK